MSSTISTLGTQSGMDLKSVIDAMVSNYKSTLETSVTTQKKLMEVQISGISTLKSSVSTFSDKVSKLLDDDSYTPVSVSRENTDSEGNELKSYPYGISAKSGASAGRYDISVLQTAKSTEFSSKIASDSSAYKADSDGNLVTDKDSTLTFTKGTGDDAKTFTVSVKAGSSVDDVRKAINDASGNFGISANYVRGNDGAYNLSIQSDSTGASNEVSITGDIAILGMDESKGSSDSIKQHAQDAKINVNGTEISSDTNTFDKQVSGVTITAYEESAKNDDGSHATVHSEISRDYSSVTSTVSAMFSGLNELSASCEKLGKRDTYTNGVSNYDGGDLAGSSITQNLPIALKNVILKSDNLPKLLEYGVTMAKDGTFSLDSSKFQKALKEDYTGVTNAFKELGNQMNASLKTYTRTGGILDTYQNSSKSQLDSYEKRLEQYDERVSAYENTLTARFSKLDKLVSTWNGYSSSLTSIFKQLQNSGD